MADFLKSLDGESRVVMEFTGSYYLPIAYQLHAAGIFVSVVHAKLLHGYGSNTICKVKTDKKDAIKIANYGFDRWLDLTEYIPEEDIRQLLKTYNRQYAQYTKISTMLKNNLSALLDQTFPSVNTLFTSPPRKSDGHEKWFDFAKEFWHCECICGLSEKRYVEHYRKWCRKAGYNFAQSKAEIFTLKPAATSTRCHKQLHAASDYTGCFPTQRDSREPFCGAQGDAEVGNTVTRIRHGACDGRRR